MIGAGWDNTAYLVNQSLIFRFPRRSAAAPLVETEIQLLPWLAARVPIRIPIPRYRGEPSSRYRWAFVGHAMIPGRLLPAARQADAARAALAAALGRFLAALHRVPHDEAATHGAGPDLLDRLNVERRLEATAERLSALVAADVIRDRRAIESVLEQAPVTTPRADTLVHGDLHAGQIVVDDSNRMCGVIDWGDVHVGDPAVDLAAVHAMLPRQCHDAFLRAYGAVDDVSWQAARARATWHSVALLAYAVDTGDTDLMLEASQAVGRITGSA
jgi:aminoglycoside phosphotransferase (APT) family kinase protein